MSVIKVIICIVGAFLIGGIPTGYLLVKIKDKKDVRDFGSGNIGFTNVVRVSGIILGSFVLIIDVGKSFLTVYFLSRILENNDFPRFLIALAVINGNIFSPFLGFKGGKGVATGLGTAIAMSPYAIACALIVFGITVYISRFVSLGSLIGSFTFALITIILYLLHHQSVFTMVFSMLLFLTVIWTHIPNIKRLQQGTENKIGKKQ